MLKQISWALACAGALIHSTTQAATFADSVTAYHPGTGYATDFGSGQGLTNSQAALGQPSIVTPGQFGGPVNPFNPPYLGEQITSIGAGGSLTLGFTSPIRNDAQHLFGIDFVIYGNAGFVITNGDYTGGGVTDGSLFSANPGSTRVSVSADNLTYFELDPSQAPVMDTLFPTDGSGRFDLAVNPELTAEDFNGTDLAGIRTLYGGAAGGAGLDISWARDANGQPVDLSEVRFVRIDVLTGAAEVDGVSALGLVPEPATWTLLALGVPLLFGILPRQRYRSSRLSSEEIA